jgi:hypothetical protein
LYVYRNCNGRDFGTEKLKENEKKAKLRKKRELQGYL